MTTTAIDYPLPRERNLIIVTLLVLAAAAWALLVWQSSMVDDDEMMDPTMGMAAPVFLAIWVAMMVAMMFPTAMPMILTFAHVQAGKAARDQATVPVGIFVAWGTGESGRVAAPGGAAISRRPGCCARGGGAALR